jgi:DNA (cytosine-5)-methyltransferase 1
MATPLRAFETPQQGALPFTAGSAPEPLEKAYSVVSMFSGCGGMDLGFLGGFKIFKRTYSCLPFRIVWANELNPAACKTYRRNVGADIYCADVWDAIDSMPKQTDVLIGGFPCQDISVNGKRAGVNGKRTGLYKAMLEGIKRTNPKIFVAEHSLSEWEDRWASS